MAFNNYIRKLMFCSHGILVVMMQISFFYVLEFFLQMLYVKLYRYSKPSTYVGYAPTLYMYAGILAGA